MTTARRLVGRALQPIRPGRTIKAVLLGETPLRDGQLVTEASITDIHNSYKRLIQEENQTREKKHHLRGMNVYSFTTIFKFARYLGLVEFVRNEPRHEPSYGNLHRVEDGKGLHIVPGTRRIFRLSEKGREDTESWEDLRRTWQESR